MLRLKNVLVTEKQYHCNFSSGIAEEKKSSPETGK